MPASPTSFRYGPLEVYKGKGGRWFWRLRAANNKIVADGAQGYGSAREAMRGFDAVVEAANYAANWAGK